MSFASNDQSLPQENAVSGGTQATVGGADSPAALITAALAYLAQHMQTGCQRSGALAAMLLERLASDARADVHLRQHARQLAEILDADPQLAAFAEAGAIRVRNTAPCATASSKAPLEHSL
ncbi:hypothetical protein [Rhodocyclus tenuis]|uniref:hypothetical protein n=1 Tax=Rhodocyclus tenuis TaxID=1066 RepID=UPI00190379BD|nr:hypothetical protein [Rhodocyclus tenuis]MBK1679538.1 hypothetical protein [Rhodocyclus tenuis]